jgi:hypothetical protein
MSYKLTASLIIASSAITFIAGIQQAAAEYGKVAGYAIMLLGIATTAVSAWEAFVSPKESWRMYCLTRDRLHLLQDEIDLAIVRSRAANDCRRVDEFFKRYAAIIDEQNSSWQRVRGDKGGKKQQ